MHNARHLQKMCLIILKFSEFNLTRSSCVTLRLQQNINSRSWSASLSAARKNFAQRYMEIQDLKLPHDSCDAPLLEAPLRSRLPAFDKYVRKCNFLYLSKV